MMSLNERSYVAKYIFRPTYIGSLLDNILLTLTFHIYSLLFIQIC